MTDLMQRPVYGLFACENADHKDPLPFFSYDTPFGSVLNCFVVQAVTVYPLTIYGKGDETKGCLNIKHRLNCIRLSLEGAAEQSEIRIFNQFVETFSVNDLAEHIQRVGNGLELNMEIQTDENPWKKAEYHYYNPACTGSWS